MMHYTMLFIKLELSICTHHLHNNKHMHTHTQYKGSGSIFSVVRQRVMETYGVLGRCEIFEFNYIHDYDVIIISHERLSASKVQVLACYHCRRVLKLTRQREKMVMISKKQLNPRNTSHFMNKLMRQKSGPAKT